MLNDSQKKLDEEALVERLRSGDESAMAKLYDMYSATLYGVIVQVVKVEEVAEDVLQESFLKVWTSINLYDARKGRLFTWMINICRNAAIDKIRTKAYRVSNTSEQLQTNHRPDFITEAFNPEHIGIRDIVEKLHPEQKQIIDLMYFEGLTQSEIAETYQIPLGTVKTRARSAVKFLSKFFKGRA